MSRNLRLSSEVELAAIMQRMRSPRSEMRAAENAHRVSTPPIPRKPPTIYPLVGMCRQAGLPEPVPEFRFHATRKWRADYAWPLHRVLVEIDGGAWTGGRHTRGAGFIADMEKLNAAALLGFHVLRYTPQQLKQAITDLRIMLADSLTR